MGTGWGGIMSDTLTNSGPLETGTTPVEENSENNKTSHSTTPDSEKPVVSTQANQYVAEDVTTRGEAQGSLSIEDSASTNEEEEIQRLRVVVEGAEDGVKSEEEDRSSIAIVEGAEDGAKSEEEDHSSTTAEIGTEEDAENGEKVGGEVPETAPPVDTQPPEASNGAGPFSNRRVQAVVTPSLMARLRSNKRRLWMAIAL